MTFGSKICGLGARGVIVRRLAIALPESLPRLTVAYSLLVVMGVFYRYWWLAWPARAEKTVVDAVPQTRRCFELCGWTSCAGVEKMAAPAPVSQTSDGLHFCSSPRLGFLCVKHSMEFANFANVDIPATGLAIKNSY